MRFFDQSAKEKIREHLRAAGQHTDLDGSVLVDIMEHLMAEDSSFKGNTFDMEGNIFDDVEKHFNVTAKQCIKNK